MRALVTGGSGFIGSNLVDALLERGDEVTVLDDLSTGRRENLDGAIAAGAELVELDIRDAEAVSDLVGRTTPEVIFHLAAQIDVRKSAADPALDSRINVEGTVNLLEAARGAGVRRVVNTSTGGAIYGEGKILPAPEDHPVAPEAPYGLSKFCAEGYCDLFAAPARALHRLAALRQRLRPAPGPARRGRAWWRSSAASCSRASGRPCSATASRPATTCSSATSWRRTCSPPSRTPPAPSTSAPASRPACSTS